MLTTEELADAREDMARELLAQVARHDRQEERETGVGNALHWVPKGDLLGQLRRAQGRREEVAGEQRRARAEYEWLMQPYPPKMPADRRLRAGDRLTLRDGQAGEASYHVVEGDDGRAAAVLLVVPVVRVGGGD